MRNLNIESGLIERAYREGHFDDVLLAIERIPETSRDLSYYYLIARIYESGKSSRGLNYDKAIEYFNLLDREGSKIGSVGAEGLARTLSKKDCCSNQKLIEQYCLRAIDLDGSLPASFMLAQMYEKCQGNYDAARRHYLRVFFHGRPYGLRYYARSHISHGSKIIGIFAHIATTLISPFLFIANRGSVNPEIR